MRKGRKHPGYQHSYRDGICQMCGDPESHTFAGMETAVALQAEAATQYQGEQLTAKLLEPLGDINTKAEDIERNSPLFFGQVHPTLF